MWRFSDQRSALSVTRLLLACVITPMLMFSLVACGGGGGGASTATSIVSQPTDQSVVEGTSASFVVLAEHAKVYQWQVTSGNGWVDISGALSASYRTAATTLSMSGQQYRVVVSGESGSVISSAASLTVTRLAQAPAISVAPVSAAVHATESASFVVTASGTDLVYQWQQSRDGVVWTDLAGANQATLKLASVSAADNGLSVRVIVSNAKGSVTSPAALLSVGPPPVTPTIAKPPADSAVLVGQTATFEALAVGTPTPMLRWQRSSDGGASWQDIAGATAESYTTPTLTSAEDGQLFRLVASNSAGSVNSIAARLRVQPLTAPALLTQPQDQSLRVPATAEFSAQFSGTPTPTLQWQHSSDGGQTWANINGATAASYSLGEVSSADNGRRLRVIASNSSGSVTSRAALLSVSVSPRLLALAGRAAGPGHLDGPALDAMIDQPVAVALGASGDMYIADTGSHLVRRMAANTGMVSTLAGRPYEPGDNDGARGTSRLREPRALAVDATGAVFVVEGRTRIRKIDSTGLTSTVAYRPKPILDEYTRSFDIGGIAADLDGNMYFTDFYVVYKIDRQGQLSILAGQDNVSGFVDGKGSAARFHGLEQIKYHNGVLIVNQGGILRSVSLSGEVQTLDPKVYSVRDGFFLPVNAAGDPITAARYDGIIYSAPRGYGPRTSNYFAEVNVIAGRPLLHDWRDGPASLPPVVGPTVGGIARDAAGNVYFSSGGAVRKLMSDGSISTHAGHAAIRGQLDGMATDARFEQPGDLLASGGRLYVCDGPRVRVIDANRRVSTLASWPQLYDWRSDGYVNCMALAQDGTGMLYVATNNGAHIFKIDPSNGTTSRVSPAIEDEPQIPSGIAVDAQGNLLISDRASHLIYRIPTNGDGSRAGYLAGKPYTGAGYQDGPAASARFDRPAGLVVAGDGSVYVADEGNHVIRRIDPQGNVSTVLGVAGHATVILGDTPWLRSPHRLAIWAQDQLLIPAPHQVLRAVVPGVECQCAPRALRARSSMR